MFNSLFSKSAGSQRKPHNIDELRSRVASYVGDSALPVAEAARLTEEVVREILDRDEQGWESDVEGHFEAARHRLRDADLFRRGLTLEQLEPLRIHYAK